jgi:uncharacterized PurR-regulated membrane protein YhhQ (DUF165 family)
VIKRILFTVVALATLGAAAATVVVAAAFALYACLELRLGRAAAAAAVALAFAILAALVGLVLALQAKGGGRRRPPEPTLTERLSEMARERPILAAGGALAAGLLALKNPQVVATIVSAFLAAKAGDKTGRNRR